MDLWLGPLITQTEITTKTTPPVTLIQFISAQLHPIISARRVTEIKKSHYKSKKPHRLSFPRLKNHSQYPITLSRLHVGLVIFTTAKQNVDRTVQNQHSFVSVLDSDGVSVVFRARPEMHVERHQHDLKLIEQFQIAVQLLPDVIVVERVQIDVEGVKILGTANLNLPGRKKLDHHGPIPVTSHGFIQTKSVTTPRSKSTPPPKHERGIRVRDAFDTNKPSPSSLRNAGFSTTITHLVTKGVLRYRGPISDHLVSTF